jgi:hypothetical protein
MFFTQNYATLQNPFKKKKSKQTCSYSLHLQDPIFILISVVYIFFYISVFYDLRNKNKHEEIVLITMMIIHLSS